MLRHVYVLCGATVTYSLVTICRATNQHPQLPETVRHLP